MRTHRHIAKNLRWSVLTKIIYFFSSCLVIMDPFIIGVWEQKTQLEPETQAGTPRVDRVDNPTTGAPGASGPTREQPGLRGHGCYKVVSSMTETAAWLLSPQGGVFWGGGQHLISRST